MPGFDKTGRKGEKMEMTTAKPIEKVPLNQYVVDAILEAVRNKELKLGDKLPSEGQLCEQFNVGRHVIREALRRLQEMSIVETAAGKGTFICSAPPESLGPQASALLLIGSVDSKDLFDFRLAIESYAAYFAAKNITADNAGDLTASLEEMRRTKDSEETSKEFLSANYRFHKELVKLSGNQMYIILYNTMNDMLGQLVRSYPYSAESTHESYQEHYQIYQAIVSHNAERAFQLEREHLSRLRKRRYGEDSIK